MHRFERPLLLTLVLVLGATVAKAGWIETKARLAQVLIASAWQKSLQTGKPQVPWPWADTWPVARLTTPSGEHFYVLDSGSGQALAFGPGRLPTPENSGSMIAGHRDTHFRFLQDLLHGDELLVQTLDGRRQRYRVQAQRIANSQTDPLHPGPPDELQLITCYPFDTPHSGGPLRYVVSAKAIWM